jgi:tRNA-dependent cyclodipeptide synthase
MSPYKVIVRNSPGWRDFPACTLGVSVNSPNWQDEKFASILEFAAANFETIRIDVTDALYRHNFMAEGVPNEQALHRANALGALWLARHQDLLTDHAEKIQIVRWAEWYSRPEFQSTLAAFHRAYDINPDLRQAVQEDVHEFFRRQGRLPSLAQQEHSKNYLIEEMAVNCLQARELSSVKIYPGDELQCLKLVRSGAIKEAPRGMEHEQFAKIKFHSRAEQPQPSFKKATLP